MKRSNQAVMVLAGILALALVGCAALTQTTGLTPKQQATIWMEIYSFTYDDTMALAKNPAITPAQKELVAKKKAVLTQVWPLLKSFVAVVNSGGTPTAQDTAAITVLINQLTALALQGK